MTNEKRRYTVETFSDVALPLSPGMRRIIEVRHRDGDEPVLRVLRTRDGSPAGCMMVYRREVDVLREALELAQRTIVGDGRRESGSLQTRGGMQLAFSVSRDDRFGPSLFLQYRAPSGHHIGKPTILSGRELQALEHAVRALRSTNHQPKGST